MAVALSRFFSRWRPVTCPCTNPDNELFPALPFDGALPGEFELPI